MAMAVGTFSLPCTSSISVDVRTDGVAHRLDDLDRLVPLPSVHLEIDAAERVPLQRGEPHLHRGAGAVRVVLGVTAPWNQWLA